ncbi:MAG: acyl-CoA desaturase [Gammaproteobacteria bacterium]|nr:acyl-CoA desaturase [Gammaproteobacteria bacterium]
MTSRIAGKEVPPAAPDHEASLPPRGSIWRWLSNDTLGTAASDDDHVDPWRAGIFLILHLGCLAVFVTGVSPVAAGAAMIAYLARMFFITAFYHRYFSHRAFRASRTVQLLMAVAGTTAGQRGPLWWAAHHRLHHRHSDRPADPHSPSRRGFAYSHCGWFLTRENFHAPVEYMRDWLRFPELRWVERLAPLLFIGFGAFCYGAGALLARIAPELGTSGAQMFVWVFLISTVVLYHATYTINSVAHRFGSRRFETPDDSRNNPVLALLTLGEGWHNNHHRFPNTARQGFAWWELDISYVLLVVLASLGVVRDLKPIPAAAQAELARLSAATGGGA